MRSTPSSPESANVYGDRLGRLVAHGRYARFDPLSDRGRDAGLGLPRLEGGRRGGGRILDPRTRRISAASRSARDLDKVINLALASPHSDDEAVNYATQVVDRRRLEGQVRDPRLVGAGPARRRRASRTATRSAIRRHAWLETKRFAEYYVLNYAEPQNRVTSITFRSSNLAATGSRRRTWALLSECDINDRVAITLGSPGGGGFTGEQFYVEGVHETYRPAGPELDDVTLTLDLSPFDYYQDNPFADPP